MVETAECSTKCLEAASVLSWEQQLRSVCRLHMCGVAGATFILPFFLFLFCEIVLVVRVLLACVAMLWRCLRYSIVGI